MRRNSVSAGGGMRGVARRRQIRRAVPVVPTRTRSARRARWRACCECVPLRRRAKLRGALRRRAPRRRPRPARRHTPRSSRVTSARRGAQCGSRRVVGPRQRRAALNPAEARRVGARLVVAVEECAERVVVGLLDRIVLVVVAARAADREPQERGSERVVRALDHVLGFVLGVDRAVLGRALADAQIRRREDLLARRIRQQIAGELPRGELVERPVARERVDDPVAVRPEQPVVMIVEEAVASR